MKAAATALAAIAASLFAASAADAAKKPTRLWYDYVVPFSGAISVPPHGARTSDVTSNTSWTFASDRPVLLKRDRGGDVSFASRGVSDGIITHVSADGLFAGEVLPEGGCPSHTVTCDQGRGSEGSGSAPRSTARRPPGTG